MRFYNDDCICSCNECDCPMMVKTEYPYCMWCEQGNHQGPLTDSE